MKNLILTLVFMSSICIAMDQTQNDQIQNNKEQLEKEIDDIFNGNGEFGKEEQYNILNDSKNIQTVSGKGLYYKIYKELKKIRDDYYADYLFIRTSGEASFLQNNTPKDFRSKYEREGGCHPCEKRYGTNLKSEEYKNKFFESVSEEKTDTLNGFRYKKIEELWKIKNKDKIIEVDPLDPKFLENYFLGLGIGVEQLETSHFLGKVVAEQLKNIRLLIKKSDLFTGKLLEWMQKTMHYMSIIECTKNAKQYQRFSNLYLLFQDLFCVFLAYQQNYTNDH